jgi:hypothetical protein
MMYRSENVIAKHVVVFMINTQENMNNTNIQMKFRMYPGTGPLLEAPSAPLTAGLTMLIMDLPDSM